VYQGSRLILNLLEANCPLDQSLYPNSTIETIRFCQAGLNGYTVVNTFRGNERGTSLDEEIHEVER